MKISVITVCYNAVSTISDTLSSIAKQDYHNVEHIIVDGASDDGTVDLIKKTVSKNVIWVSEKDRGLYDAMNKGIALATGEVICFLNADDFYPAGDSLSQMAQVFLDPSVEACYADLCYVNQNEVHKIVRYWKTCRLPPKAFVNSWAPPHPTLFIRRDVYECFGGFDLDYPLAADFELMLRFLKVHSINTVYLPKVIVHMRVGGATNRSFKNIINQNLEIIRSLRKFGYSPILLEFFARKFFSRLFQFLLKENAAKN